MKDEFQIETMAVHAGEGPCPTTGALDTPIYMSSSFAAPTTDELAAIFEEKQEGYVYTRYGNPTLKALEDKMAALEGAEAGMAAATGHIDHVRTQLPYALLAGGIATTAFLVLGATL